MASGVTVETEIIEDWIPELIVRVNSTARAAVMATADAIRDSAKANAPVVTGYLKDSIESNSLAIGYEAEVTVGAEYGIYVEFGTRFMAAEPFLGPAFEEHWKELPDAIMVSMEAPLG